MLGSQEILQNGMAGLWRGDRAALWCKSKDDINNTVQNVSQIPQNVSQIPHKDFKTPFLKCIDHMKKCIKYHDIYFEKM